MVEILTAPHLGTAEEDVLVAEWMVAEGEAFKKGQVLLVLETLKASFEIEAEADGTLHRQLAPQGERIPLQAPLGAWGAPGSALDEAALERALASTGVAAPAEAEAAEERADATASPTPTVAGDARVPAAPAARLRAAELGLDLASIEGTGSGGLVKLADVERAASTGAVRSKDAGDGRLDPAFLAHVRRDRRAFAALDSAFKLALYRRHGARIGRDARLGEGTVVLTERLVLGDGCVLADGVSVEGRELVAGDLLYLGPRSRVRCTSVRLGDNAFFAEEADIGGGGGLDPESALVVGSHGFVGEGVHLNPCRGITIGDEVVLSRGAVIMTHSFGGSLLAGYPVRFAPVTIGDGAQVGIGATLFPGVEMGAGSILLSGSSLVTSMPPGRLFGGVPATDLKAAARPLSEAERGDRARETVVEFARQLELRGFEVHLEAGDELELTVQHEGRVHRLRFAPELSDESGEPAAEEVLVAMRAQEATWTAIEADRVAIDLGHPAGPRIRGAQGPLADAFREWLRKQGVRLEPRAWTYRGGWL